MLFLSVPFPTEYGHFQTKISLAELLYFLLLYPSFFLPHILCFSIELDTKLKKAYNNKRVRQTVAGYRKGKREESPGFIEQGCRLTAGGGDSKDSATENKRQFW